MWRQSENCGHINAHYYDSFRCFSVIKIRLLSYDQFHRNGLILTKSHLLLKGVGFPGDISELVIRTCLPMQVDLRDTGWIPGLGRSPGGGHSNSLQCSCLDNPRDGGDSRATAPRIAESWT